MTHSLAKGFFAAGFLFAAAFGEWSTATRQNLEPLWTKGTAETPVRWVMAADERLYLFEPGGRLELVESGSGTGLAGVNLGREPLSQPLIDGNRIFLASPDRHVGAWDLATGKALWNYSPGNAVVSDLGLNGPVLSFAVNEPVRTLVALRTSDAALLACVPFTGRILSAPLFHDDGLYVGTTGGTLYRYSPVNGLLLDSLQTRGEFVHQKIVAVDQRLLVAAGGDLKKTFCLAREAGLNAGEEWSLDFTRPYYPDADEMSRILLSRPQAREKLLREMLSRLKTETPALDLDTAFLPRGPVYFSGWVVDHEQAAILVREPDGLSRALYHVILAQLPDGKILFHAQVRDEDVPYLYCPEPLLGEDLVIAQIGKTRILGFSRSSGAILFENRAPSEIKPPLLTCGNALLCLTHAGTLTALSLETQDHLPLTFALSPNRPNPFNPVTMLSFQLPVRSRVLLKIFNARGQAVAVLADEMREAGRYRINWKGMNNSGKEMPSGIYFATLKAGPYKKTVKMTLAK